MCVTPTQELNFFGKKLWVKRDDLARIEGVSEHFNGNKARKFYALLHNPNKIFLSYGGNQSNAMLALSALTHAQKKRFIYVTPTPSQFLRENKNGNFALAREFGAEFIFADSGTNALELKNKALAHFKTLSFKEKYFIPQGGDLELAKEGTITQCKEIWDFIQKNFSTKEALVFCATGSGVSALALAQVAKELKYNMQIVPILCAKIEGFEKNFAKTLHTNFAFGALKKEVWEMYRALLRKGIEFDLLYDCPALYALKNALDSQFFTQNELEKEWIFIHSGGLLGNLTQIPRFQRKFKTL
ncbi:hypothetical protein CQA49_05515 [Helicobacter sp. MIT 00-7814]|uniref:pyridoxal-phosphate dependent enzyme n=1 Tax=unclassified Helicobacter TaxID=2593540 RepID=UPI000E1F08B1|nr:MULTISPECIES: pyridoxal-phosphate dependent enzyme [unclassified Helicobacter]RDU53684.1 hypothetical protein CQA37_06660 [Helicobacter sp. MIT 99-10781]RDU54070.1 hypothetical protein CQA49_05515 [Helicobacter sp. MIT 00-7814]